MKLLKKTLVAAGLATAVFATGAAQAASINNPSTAANPTVGQTITNESTRTTITPVATVIALDLGEGLSVNDSITFTLNSGVWGAIATADLTGGGTVALVSGGAATSAAVYRVTVAVPAASTLTLAATANITGTAIPDGTTITVQVDMNGFVGGAATSLFGSPLTSLNTSMSPAMSAVVTTAVPTGANSGTFDVATGFATLTAGAVAGVSTSAIADVTTTANAAAVAGSTTTVGGNQPAGPPTPAATLLTVMGPMTGVTSIGSPNILGTTGAGLGTTPVSTGVFNIDTANNVAWGTQVATGATPITITFAGTQAYDASAYTVAVSRLADAGAGYAANASIGSGTLFSFTRNGSSFTTNSFGSLNKLTVTDRSNGLGGTGADGAIALTAYDAAGAAVTCTGLTIANIPNNGTTTIQGADVMAACAGAKRIEGIVNSTS
ncbi:MAG TPA: hypothetical protein EYG42_13245, partial [Porticoccaceae bacterium]|nr:hypothetical protein [Porticoccaceae bacterium]